MTDNDKALLEDAARAAGYKMVWWHQKPALETTSGSVTTTSFWNPLTDPGDALRLAVKLTIDIRLHEGRQEVTGFADDQIYPVEKYGTDPLAATCRAITRAAAEIYRSKGK